MMTQDPRAPRRPAPTILERLLRSPLQVAVVVSLVILVLLTLRTTLPSNGQAAYSPEQFAEELLNGLAQGSIYSLIAVGYVLAYSVLSLIHFPHGEVLMTGAYTSFFVIATAQQSGVLQSSPSIVLILALVAAMAASTIAAVSINSLVYRPMRNAPRTSIVIAALGTSVGFQQVFYHLFDPANRVLPEFSLFAFPELCAQFGASLANSQGICSGVDLISGEYDVLFVGLVLRIVPVQVVTLVIAMLLLLSSAIFMRSTRLGKAVRALADDKEVSALIGIRVEPLVTITFVVGAVLAGSAGMLSLLANGTVSPFMGTMAGLKGFAAGTLGGFGGISGAIWGGLILGVIESVMPSILGISPQTKDIIVLVMLMILLLSYFATASDVKPWNRQV